MALLISKPFLRGTAFPFRKGPTGFPLPATDDDVVRNSLIRLLGLQRGECTRRLDLGTNAYRLLFEPNDAALAELMREEVMTTVAKYEQRALLQEVTVERQETEVIVTLYYVNRSSRKATTLPIIFPNPLGVP